ncbi:MAG: tetratricopeptide repeat protein [Deltaproteobacteria bacterium]|nr:tetratricopeptide repeat protein [Deltaproteobacteria bacterium]
MKTSRFRGMGRGVRVALGLAIALACGCGSDDVEREPAPATGPTSSVAASDAVSKTSASAASAAEDVRSTGGEPAGFVGSATCTACHAEQAQSWSGSQHRLAMDFATADSVKAPFAGESLHNASGTLRFERQGRAFLVRRDAAARGPTGPGPGAAAGDERSDLRVSGTFGVEPLQQYLLDAVGGRIQVLPWAWDTRPASEGGQRWLDLYPDAADPEDPLHFSRPAQNWNHVCADCHVTGYRKRYDEGRKQFESRWEELGVGCEGCHGPGREHVRWAASRESVAAGAEAEADAEDDAHADANGDAGAGADRGLVARLDERRGVVWAIDPATGNAVRSRPRTSGRELDVCAQCHARRGAITERYVAGEPFLDHYRPTLLDRGLYHADGQQRDEVYTYGSFLQSRMHAKGVTCSDCHDPHSGGLRAEGNALCGNCHAPERYATPAHHHHRADSSGSRCVACHMPTTTYMEVDPRHDHSLRVPRPDQAKALGVPDACGGCHAGKEAVFSDAAVRRWLGRPAKGFERHAEAIDAAESDAIGAGAKLRAVAADASQPVIVRATALARLDPARGGANAEVLVGATRDPDPLVRLGALEGLANAGAEVRLRAAAALLDDPRRAVRFEAVRVLAPVTGSLSQPSQAAFARASAEYVASLRRDADRPEARTQLGVFLAEGGDADGARRELEAALALEPAFEAAHVNLADLERALGRDESALAVLDAGLARLPGSAALHHARGLARIRLGRPGEALADLAKAVSLAPDSTRFAYVQAVALESTGARDRAIALLEGVATAHPGDAAVREALVGYLEAEGRLEAAKVHRAALALIAESDP